MKVLVVAAHPDDEVLGVGGAVAGHVRRGERVKVALMCEGVSVRYQPERQAEVARQAQKAADTLGVSELVLGAFPDQGLDQVPFGEVVREMEALVSSFEPSLVYTHFGGDLNRDHRILSEAVLLATRPYSAPSVREVLMFETPSSTEWSSPQLAPPFQPCVYVDISGVLELKLEAFECYRAEVRDAPHPRSVSALRTRALYWGSVANCRAAEAFTVVRSLR